jgi:hypothetical protein
MKTKVGKSEPDVTHARERHKGQYENSFKK